MSYPGLEGLFKTHRYFEPWGINLNQFICLFRPLPVFECFWVANHSRVHL